MKPAVRNTLLFTGLIALALSAVFLTKPAHAAFPFEDDKYFVDARYDEGQGDNRICGTIDFFNVESVPGGVDFEYQLIWETSETDSVVRLGTGNRNGLFITLLDTQSGSTSLPFFTYTTDSLGTTGGHLWTGALDTPVGPPAPGRFSMRFLDLGQGWDCSLTW